MVAQGHFNRGQDEAAHGLASVAAARSGEAVAEIHWLAGISAWRLGRIDVAGAPFQDSGSGRGRPSGRAGAGCVLGRACPHGALSPGRPPAAAWRWPPASRRASMACSPAPRWGARSRTTSTHASREGGMAEAVLRFEGARRALALAQVGQLARAEAEIRKLAARATPDLMVALIGLARSLDLPAVQMAPRPVARPSRPPPERALPAAQLAAGHRLQPRPRAAVLGGARRIGLRSGRREPRRRPRPDADHARHRALHRRPERPRSGPPGPAVRAPRPRCPSASGTWSICCRTGAWATI